ncbi:pyridoxal-phosphate dependent enzyme [Mesorhizobium sp. M7D.F.Ca.US.004.03.1.1]|nr:pyridoxal-phosphate dependent enzyme [Mesorhizobium sp. M7D.F.Ca.US.004.01.2.1]RVA24903.1 pyridoxal-phosphate dependent enzyme [Mesorhizobium sp. M7D.F.Ca.US.004.03.1.1]
MPTCCGNLLGGVAVALKETRATIRVIGVQSDGAAGLHDSFHAGLILSRPVRTNAECLAQRQPADFAFAVVKAFALGPHPVGTRFRRRPCRARTSPTPGDAGRPNRDRRDGRERGCGCVGPHTLDAQSLGMPPQWRLHNGGCPA